LIAARWATVYCAYGWLRAERRTGIAAMAGALFYGASPFFHGYAAEGIVEGTDGWALPLWAWAVRRDHRTAAILGFAACIVSSWYLGMVACGLAVGWGFSRRLAWWSGGAGLVLSLPALWAFTHAFGGNSPLDPAVRIAMSATLALATPFFAQGPNPFAMNTFLGFAAVVLALPSAIRRPGWAALGLTCFVLSTGRGPWWELPIFEMVRFPYRWHAGTLFVLAALLAETIDQKRWRFLGFLPWIEGLIFSPIHPILPAAPAQLPAIYAHVRGPIVLDLPGPVALPPGTPNPSRSRARYLLWAQVETGTSSPWTLDFNGVSRDNNVDWLAPFTRWDPLLGGSATPLDLSAARSAGVRQILVHRREYGKLANDVEQALIQAGAKPVAEGDGISLFEL
jgi:hypothetical protein